MDVFAVSCSNDDYSVLESTDVHGYDLSNQDYSHLEPGTNYFSCYGSSNECHISHQCSCQ